MNVFKFIMPALAILALVLVMPGQTLAETKVSGKVTSGLGIQTNDTGAASTSDWQNYSRVTITFSGSSGPVSGKYHIRYRNGHNTLDSARHAVTWKISDTMSVDFWGASFGLPVSFTAYSVWVTGHFGESFGLGDTKPYGITAFFVNQKGVNFTIKSGAMSFGFAVLDACQPACASTTEDSTYVGHFGMGFGNMAIGAFMTSSSSTNGNDSASGSALDLMFRMKTSAFAVAAEYQTTTTNSGAAGAKDNNLTGIIIGGDFGPIGFKMSTQEKDVDGTKSTTAGDNWTELSVAYTMPLGDKSSLAIGYATWSDDGDGITRDQTLLIASGQVSF